jgi:hypothetical protein
MLAGTIWKPGATHQMGSRWQVLDQGYSLLHVSVNFQGWSRHDTNKRWVFGLQMHAVQGSKYIVYKVISKIC